MKQYLKFLATGLVAVGSICACNNDVSETTCLVTEMKISVANSEVIKTYTYNANNQLSRYTFSNSEFSTEVLFTNDITSGELKGFTVLQTNLETSKITTSDWGITYSENKVITKNSDEVSPQRREYILENGKIIRLDEYFNEELEFQIYFIWEGNNVVSTEHYSVNPETVEKTTMNQDWLSLGLMPNNFILAQKSNFKQNKNTTSEPVLLAKVNYSYHDSKNAFKGTGGFFYFESVSFLSKNTINKVELIDREGNSSIVSEYSDFKLNEAGYPLSYTNDAVISSLTYSCK
ncbi:hypothetical protein EP331_01885 [bacterium]|nr:MAG: hypothetical protein EP331_01885 [bacterium]